MDPSHDLPRNDLNGMADADQTDTSLAERCRTEIEALHDVFEAWLSGTCPNTDTAFARIQKALAPTFQLIHPEGRWMARSDILGGLRDNHGGQPDLTIDIRNVQVLDAGDVLVVAAYEEWQEAPDATDARQSTVVFRRDPEAPNGLRWHHVHETWLRPPS
jgi:hypothetical protein